MATKRTNLTDTAWVEVGVGPLLAETDGTHLILLHFGDVAPNIESLDFHRLSNDIPFSYSGALRCFARAASNNTSIINTSIIILEGS